MSTERARPVMLVVGIVIALFAGITPAAPNLGEPVTAADLAGLSITIGADGRNLPPGRGTAIDGVDVYMEKCASCHGVRGQGKTSPALAGGAGTLAGKSPVRTVGSFWPYATTLFDYIRRAMPYDRPLSLTNEQVYQLTAYVLWLSGIVGRDEVIDARTLPEVKMPNRAGFVNAWDARDRR
jgi:S-disulfanyl-L-cysteine oxidoreductase SoxD